MSNRKDELESETKRAVLRVDPTERTRVVLMAISGPSQYLMGAMGPLGMLLIKSYFISVTDRSVFVHHSPRSKNHPQDLAHVIPLEQAGGLVSRVRRGRLWNVLFLHFPGDAKPTRLNISFHSGPELDRFLAKLAKNAKRP